MTGKDRVRSAAVAGLAAVTVGAPDAVERPDDLNLTDGGTRLGVTVTVKSVAEDGTADLDVRVDDEPLP